MSQQRIRKGPAGGDGSRTRASVGKASGDNVPAGQATEQNHRIQNKTLPKSIRFDLENALVGLCDVWFEEIKPYLIQNNIKLHVDTNDGGGGGGGGGSRACGDHGRPSLGATGCSHLDPASSCECELCRLLCNTANSIDSAVSQAASTTPSSEPSSSPSLVPSYTSNTSQLDISGIYFKNKTSKNQQKYPTKKPYVGSPNVPTPVPSSWPAPRYCDTYKLAPPSPLAPITRVPFIPMESPWRKIKTRNKVTQTDEIVLFYLPQNQNKMNDDMIQSFYKKASHIVRSKSTLTPKMKDSRHVISIHMKANSTVKPSVGCGDTKGTSRNTKTRVPTTAGRASASSPASVRRNSPANLSQRPTPSPDSKMVPQKQTAFCDRCPATTTLHKSRSPTRNNSGKRGVMSPIDQKETKCNTRSTSKNFTEMPVVQKDDKKIQVLYCSPSRDSACSSISNFDDSGVKGKQKKKCFRKTHPWK